MKKVLVVAPHPDDETLGCGGTLLKHKASGDSIHWLIVTDMLEEYGFPNDKVQQRQFDISTVAAMYAFDSVHNLMFPPAMLDTIPKAELVDKIGQVIGIIQPEVLYLPNKNDIHSDHKVVFEAAAACTKWFRYTSVKRILTYETLSESEFSLNCDGISSHPNVFVDINDYLKLKVDIMKCYASEMGDFPFPRSVEAIEAVARFRGATAGCKAAEAFMLLKEIL